MFDEAIENVRKTIRQLSKYCSLTQCMTIDYIYMHVKCNVSVCVCVWLGILKEFHYLKLWLSDSKSTLPSGFITKPRCKYASLLALEHKFLAFKRCINCSVRCSVCKFYAMGKLRSGNRKSDRTKSFMQSISKQKHKVCMTSVSTLPEC